MSSKSKLNTDFTSLKDFVQGLYQHITDSMKPVVPESSQLAEIRSLQKTLGDERFFFVVDMQRFEMEHCYGVQKWLGYQESEFSLKKYWDSVVHPGSKKALLLVIMKMYELLSTGTYPLEFMVQRFSAKIVLRHANGKYYQFKKTSSVFQYDEKKRLLAYLDEFTKIGEYNADSTTEPRMYNSSGAREAEKEKAILEQVFLDFLGMKVYSVNELQTARNMAYFPHKSQAELAEEADLSVHTINTYCKRLLIKTRDFFHKTEKEIPSALDAALFLRREGLL